MKIITNHHWRQFAYRDEVPSDILASEFDYQSPNEAFDGFLKYHGFWYHLDEFEIPGPEGWDAAACDSAFSATVIRVSRDGEWYQVGRLLV